MGEISPLSKRWMFYSGQGKVPISESHSKSVALFENSSQQITSSLPEQPGTILTGRMGKNHAETVCKMGWILHAACSNFNVFLKDLTYFKVTLLSGHRYALVLTLQNICSQMLPRPHLQVIWINVSWMRLWGRLHLYSALTTCDQITQEAL